MARMIQEREETLILRLMEDIVWRSFFCDKTLIPEKDFGRNMFCKAPLMGNDNPCHMFIGKFFSDGQDFIDPLWI